MTMGKYVEVPHEEHAGFTVRDRRGIEEKETPCRVCGAPVEHTQFYNQPTMECIKYFREQIELLTRQLQREDT